ncbi:MAG: hypothetical protein ABF298_00055, partial [Alteriqipengyuania sp.]
AKDEADDTRVFWKAGKFTWDLGDEALVMAILKLVFATRKDDRTWRQRWWDRLRRNVTPEERQELQEVT